MGIRSCCIYTYYMITDYGLHYEFRVNVGLFAASFGKLWAGITTPTWQRWLSAFRPLSLSLSIFHRLIKSGVAIDARLLNVRRLSLTITGPAVRPLAAPDRNTHAAKISSVVKGIELIAARAKSDRRPHDVMQPRRTRTKYLASRTQLTGLKLKHGLYSSPSSSSTCVLSSGRCRFHERPPYCRFCARW